MTEDPEQHHFFCESICPVEVGMMLSAGCTLCECVGVGVCKRERSEETIGCSTAVQCCRYSNSSGDIPMAASLDPLWFLANGSGKVTV